MLGDDETDPLYGDQRLEELRKELETHKKKAEAKGSASEVLVQRVQAGLEKGQKSLPALMNEVRRTCCPKVTT